MHKEPLLPIAESSTSPGPYNSSDSPTCHFFDGIGIQTKSAPN